MIKPAPPPSPVPAIFTDLAEARRAVNEKAQAQSTPPANTSAHPSLDPSPHSDRSTSGNPNPVR